MTEQNEEIGSEVDAFKSGLADALSVAIGNNRADMEVEEPVIEEEVVDEVPDAPEESTEEADATEEVVEEEEEIKDEFPKTPNDWSEEEKATFEVALKDPALKDQAAVFIERYDSLKKGFYKKAEETATLRKSVSQWDDVFDGNAKESLKVKGINEQDYVKSLLNVDRALSNNPADVIKKLMEGYNVTPKQLGFNEEVGESSYLDDDNEISQLKRELEEIRNSNKAKEAATTAQNNQAIETQVRDFKFAIDDNGDTKFPLFEEAKDEMAILLSTGKANTLEEAYKKSIVVREQQFEVKQTLKKEQELVKSRKKVVEAKKASRGISNKQTTSVTSTAKMTLEDRLKEKMRAYHAG